MTDLAFQYTPTGRLPWSLIFLDMTSFIIHPSTAPLISSLSAAHSSHFMSTSPAFSLGIAHHSPLLCLRGHHFSICLPALFAAHLLLLAVVFRPGTIYRVMQCDTYPTDHLSDEGDFSGAGMK